MLVVPRKLLTLLGGLMIISDFAEAGMVPVNNPNNPARRPPLAKPVSTPGVNPNQSAHRPERPATHSAGISATPQQPVTFGIMQQKPPSSYASSQSSAGNSQSHLIFTQNNVGVGSDPVLIVTSTQNAVNETENTHNVPLEQIPSIFTPVLTPPHEDSSLESSHEQSFSAPVQNVIHEQAQETVQIASASESIPIPASSAEIILEAANELQSSYSFEIPANPQHEASPSVSDELPQVIPTNETPATVATASINEPEVAANELLSSVPHESSPSAPQENSSGSFTDQHLGSVEPQSQPQVSLESPPSPAISPIAQNPATIGIISNNIVGEENHFDLNEYLAQASVVLEGATPDVLQSSEVPNEAAVVNSVQENDVSISLEEQPLTAPSDTGSSESIPVNEQPSTIESVELTQESTQVQEQPLQSPALPDIDTNLNEILQEHVVPDHISTVEVSPVNVVAGEESPVVENVAENHESVVEQITDQNENVNLASHVEEAPVVEELEMSHVSPEDLPNNVQDQSEPIDPHVSSEINSGDNLEDNLNNIEEQSVLSELLGPVSSSIPSSEVPSPEVEAVVPEPSEINPTLNSAENESEIEESSDILQVSPIQVDDAVSVEYTSLSAAPPAASSAPAPPAASPSVPAVNYNAQPGQINNEEDPPFNVEEYLAQAALILGSYQPYGHDGYDKHMSANELYYSDRHKAQHSSGQPQLFTGKGITEGNFVNGDQYYNSDEAKRLSLSPHNVEPSKGEVLNENVPLGFNPPAIIKSNEVMSQGAPEPPSQSAQHNTRPLPPGLDSQEFDENSLLTVANLEVDSEAQNEVFSVQNVAETEELQPFSSNDDPSSSKAGAERARPPRPGFSRPSQMGIAPVYTYSGGKLNTPVGEDIKLTHGSISTANSKNQNGTFSLLHDSGKAPQHAMVSQLGSTAFNSYFNGSQITVPTNTATFTTAQSPSPTLHSLSQPQPSVQHAVLNNTNIVGTLETQNKPSAPSAYHNYYFPQDSVKSANILINNGVVRPVSYPYTTKDPEVSLIPQLESEIKSFQNDVDTLGAGQSVLDLLSQDRKKAAVNGGNNNMVKRASTSASGKSLGKKVTTPDKAVPPVVSQEDKTDTNNEVSDSKVSYQEDAGAEEKEEENAPEKAESQPNEEEVEKIESEEPEALESLEQPLETSVPASQMEEEQENQHETLSEEKEQETIQEELLAVSPNSMNEEMDTEVSIKEEKEQETEAPTKPETPSVNLEEGPKDEKMPESQKDTQESSIPVKQSVEKVEKPQSNKPKPQNSKEGLKDETIPTSQTDTLDSSAPVKQQGEKSQSSKPKPSNSNAKEGQKDEKIPATPTDILDSSAPVKQQGEKSQSSKPKPSNLNAKEPLKEQIPEPQNEAQQVDELPSPSNKPKAPNAKESPQDQKSPATQKDTQASSNPSKQPVDESTSSSRPAPAKDNPPKSPPAPQPSQKDSAPPAAGPSGPSLPQPPPAPILVAPPPIPDAMSAPSFGEISIPEPNINTPNVPQDISEMIGTVSIPPVPTLGDGSKSSNNKGLPASPAKPKPPKRPNQGPGKGNSPQIPKPLAAQQGVAQIQEQQYNEAVETQSVQLVEILSETVEAEADTESEEDTQTDDTELSLSEEIISEESEMEGSEEDEELSPNFSHNEPNEDTRQQNEKEKPFTTEKALPSKHGRPFPPGFGGGNPNPMFGNNPPMGPGSQFQAPLTPLGSTNAAPDKGCTCNNNNNNNNNNINPNIDNYSAGNNNPNTNNNANAGGKNPSTNSNNASTEGKKPTTNNNANTEGKKPSTNNSNANTGGKNPTTDNNNGAGKNPNDNSSGGGKYTPPSKNNTPSKNPAPAPAPSAPSPVPVIDDESEDEAQSNVRPPRPSKPKRPVRPNGGNKKPKPKPSTDKLKDVEVDDDDIDHLLFQDHNITFSDSRVTTHKKPDNKLEAEMPLVNNSSAAVVNATTTPAKQTELISTVNVYGWEIPYINWSYFTDIFQSFFVEKFRTSSGEFTCDESDNEVTILRSELDVDYLCGDDADFSRRDVRTLGESNICNMFCNSNGFSSGMCMPQKSCLCYMSDTKNFAIKLERLQDFNNNSTEKFSTSDSEDACQKCRCLKSCQTHGKYVGYCSKSCHCGVPWYNENPNQEVPIV